MQYNQTNSFHKHGIQKENMNTIVQPKTIINPISCIPNSIKVGVVTTGIACLVFQLWNSTDTNSSKKTKKLNKKIKNHNIKGITGKNKCNTDNNNNKIQLWDNVDQPCNSNYQQTDQNKNDNDHKAMLKLLNKKHEEENQKQRDVQIIEQQKQKEKYKTLKNQQENLQQNKTDDEETEKEEAQQEQEESDGEEFEDSCSLVSDDISSSSDSESDKAGENDIELEDIKSSTKVTASLESYNNDTDGTSKNTMKNQNQIENNNNYNELVNKSLEEALLKDLSLHSREQSQNATTFTIPTSYFTIQFVNKVLTVGQIITIAPQFIFPTLFFCGGGAGANLYKGGCGAGYVSGLLLNANDSIMVISVGKGGKGSKNGNPAFNGTSTIVQLNHSDQLVATCGKCATMPDENDDNENNKDWEKNIDENEQRQCNNINDSCKGYVFCSNEKNFENIYHQYAFCGKSGTKYLGGHSLGPGGCIDIGSDINGRRGGGGACDRTIGMCGSGGDGCVELFYFDTVLK